MLPPACHLHTPVRQPARKGPALPRAVPALAKTMTTATAVAELAAPPIGSEETLAEPERALLMGAAQTAMLFDDAPGFIYVVKDARGRYVSFNASLTQRLQVAPNQHLQHCRATELWPADLAQRFEAQDHWVRQQQTPLLHQLDPIVLPDLSAGWCVTHKFPLHAQGGRLVGLLCLSRDVPGLRRTPGDEGLMRAVDQMTKHCELRLQVSELAALAGMSPARFAALIRRIYGLSPMGFVVRNRIKRACLQLRHSQDSLLQVALSAGFYDQAQFSRQFKREMGMVPSTYRQANVPDHEGLWRWGGVL
jgi:AraC-like DNA-binding protein